MCCGGIVGCAEWGACTERDCRLLFLTSLFESPTCRPPPPPLPRNLTLLFVQSDAVYEIISSDSRKFSGNQCIDEDVLERAGKKDMSVYDYRTLGATPEERLKNILRT